MTVVLSIAVTAVLVTSLNANGYNLNAGTALILAAIVPCIVAPIASWYLIGLLLNIYHVEEEMRSLASYDSLTGLLSRHAFFKSANNYFSLAKREGKVFSVLVVDLDYFKLINDQYGHAAGDAVLKLFADVTNSVGRAERPIGNCSSQ